MKFRFDQYLALILLAFIFLLPVKKADTATSFLPEIELTEINPIPVLNPTQQPELFMASISAQSVVVIDVDSAAILLEKNSHQKVAPASTTKLMTALVARDNLSLDKLISVKEKPLGIGHTIGFKLGESFLAADVFKGLLINSGNDAAEVLAQNHPQGRAAFIEAMNAKAQALHLRESNFINPSGLDAAAHYTSAFDLSLISRQLMKDSFLKSLVGTQQAQITDQTGLNQYLFYNTNLLLGTEPGVVGIKTGTTDLAGEALITQVERDQHQVMIIVLGSENRYADTKKIIDWVFSNYQWLTI